MSLGPELLLAISHEINRSYANNRIRKAEAAEGWLALLFSGDRALFFSWDPVQYGCSSASFDEIRELSEVAKNRPPFINAVKSHIVGSDLIEARALYRDRILSIEFRRTIGAGFSRKKQLIFEASGRYSNIILLDEDERIVETAKHIHADTNRYRSILPGLPYTPPPPFAGIALEDFAPDAPDAADKLEKIIGVGRPLLSGLKKMCGESPERCREILKGLSLFSQEEVKNGEGNYFLINDYLTLYPVLPPFATRRIDTSNALDASREAAILPLLKKIVARERKKLSALLENRLAINEKKIKDAEGQLKDGDEADKFLLYGKLILANAWTLPPRAAEASLSDWNEAGTVEHIIPLDPNKSASANAERYFARYRKKKASLSRAKAILPSLYEKRDELQEQLVLLEYQNDPTTLSLMAMEVEGAANKPPKGGKGHKAPPLPPHARYELPGATLYVGRSAKGNHYVTFRLARPDDIWLHAQKIPGAHVLVRFHGTPDTNAESEAFETAAACAAYYSKGRESGAVKVDYTERKHVRAIPGGGLAHVTYKEFGTIMADISIWEKFSGERFAAPPGEKL